ncbi:hypothetical protein F5888DRAFT_1738931 [Russula emetica]|nr:hypothetical protein F5888DRAFT_1738931 [Russula emetica]
MTTKAFWVNLSMGGVLALAFASTVHGSHNAPQRHPSNNAMLSNTRTLRASSVSRKASSDVSGNQWRMLINKDEPTQLSVRKSAHWQIARSAARGRPAVAGHHCH